MIRTAMLLLAALAACSCPPPLELDGQAVDASPPDATPSDAGPLSTCPEIADLCTSGSWYCACGPGGSDGTCTCVGADPALVCAIDCGGGLAPPGPPPEACPIGVCPGDAGP